MSGEQLHGLTLQDRRSSVEHAVGEARDVIGGGKKTGVSGDSAQDAGVLIVDLAAHDALAKGDVLDRGRDMRLPAQRRIVRRIVHAQRLEDLFAAQAVEGFAH